GGGGRSPGPSGTDDRSRCAERATCSGGGRRWAVVGGRGLGGAVAAGRTLVGSGRRRSGGAGPGGAGRGGRPGGQGAAAALPGRAEPSVASGRGVHVMGWFSSPLPWSEMGRTLSGRPTQQHGDGGD